MAKPVHPKKPLNPYAKALENRLFRQQKTKAKKGKVAYIRCPKHSKSLPAAFDLSERGFGAGFFCWDTTVCRFIFSIQ